MNRINPQERPNVIKLLNHKFISGVEIFYKHLEVPHEKSKTKSLSPVDNHRLNIILYSNTNYMYSKNKIKNKTIPILQKETHSVPDMLGTGENGDEYTRYTKPPVHTKPTSSIYDFQITFPIPESKLNGNAQHSTKEGSTDRKVSDGSLGAMGSSRKDSLSKEIGNNEDEAKYTNIPSLKTISQNSRSEIESLTIIKNLSEGTPTGNTTKYEIIKPQFEIRRNPETKAPTRPLGRNKRFLPKSGYTNLSEDESISGASFMMAGSPGTFPEINDDRSGNLSSGKVANSGNYLSVPNGLQGKVFQFPDSLSQLEEQEGKENNNNNKEWELMRHDKIDEEEEKDDTESEQGKEKIVLDYAGALKKEEEVNNVKEKNETSRSSVHSNPEMFSIEIEDNLEDFNKKGKKSQESSALFKHDYIARDSAKRSSLMSLKDDESTGKNEAPLQLHHIAPDFMENKIEDNELSDGLNVTRVNSSPGMKRSYKQNGYYNNRNKYEMKENREFVEDERKIGANKGKSGINEARSAGLAKKKYILSDENEKTIKFQFVP